MAVLLGAAIAVALAALAWLVHALIAAGAFSRVQVQDATLGPYLVLYTEHTGPYRQMSKWCSALTERVVKVGLWHAADAPQATRLGVFYDDPKKVPAAQCRYAVAYVFKQGADIAEPQDLAKHREWLQELSVVKAGHVKVGHIPASRCLAMRWPFTSLSILTMVLRVYPQLSRAHEQFVARHKAAPHTGPTPATTVESQTPGATPAPKPATAPTDGAATSPPVQLELQGSLEVYQPGTPTTPCHMWVGFPLTPRTELLPFDPPPAAYGLGAAGKKVA